MTWNIKDINNGKYHNPKVDVQEEEPQYQGDPLPEHTPSIDFFYQQIKEQESFQPTLKEAEYMSQVGMIPDSEWARIRKMMTRGIQPIWPSND